MTGSMERRSGSTPSRSLSEGGRQRCGAGPGGPMGSARIEAALHAFWGSSMAAPSRTGNRRDLAVPRDFRPPARWLSLQALTGSAKVRALHGPGARRRAASCRPHAVAGLRVRGRSGRGRCGLGDFDRCRYAIQIEGQLPVEACCEGISATVVEYGAAGRRLGLPALDDQAEGMRRSFAPTSVGPGVGRDQTTCGAGVFINAVYPQGVGTKLEARRGTSTGRPPEWDSSTGPPR